MALRDTLRQMREGKLAEIQPNTAINTIKLPKLAVQQKKQEPQVQQIPIQRVVQQIQQQSQANPNAELISRIDSLASQKYDELENKYHNASSAEDRYRIIAQQDAIIEGAKSHINALLQ